MPEPICLTFYTKPDCPLCIQAERLLEIVSDQRSLRVTMVNILADRETYDLYHERIPVLMFPDGSQLEAPIGRGDLVAALRRHSGSPG